MVAKKTAASEGASDDQVTDPTTIDVGVGATKDVDKANEAAEKAATKIADAQAEQAEAEAAAEKAKVESVEKTVAKAKKQGVKRTDDGLVIGIDGKNPVSNNNPDPRSVGR